MFCPKCGNEIKDGTLFCNKCGYEVTKAKEIKSIKKNNIHFSFRKLVPSIKVQKIALSVIAFLLTCSMSFGIVAESISLKSSVAEVEKKVLFDLNYDKSENFTEKVNYSTNLVSEPAIPTREGYQFVGWYTSKDYSPMFDFSTEITQDVTLFAKWNDKDNTTDSDNDGLNDSLEISLGTDPDKWDTDGDGLSDYFELNYLNYNPLSKDTNEDGIPDGDDDNDDDGLTNAEEMMLSTSPIVTDTDLDGLTDYEEVNKYSTDPTLSDTDGDGASDGIEIELEYDPLMKNSSFVTTSSLGSLSQDNPVAIEVNVTSSGESAGTLFLSEKDISENQHMLGSTSSAYVGPAYDISMEGDFTSATLTFSFHNSVYSSTDIEPCVYWFNESTNCYEEVANQTIENNKLIAEVSHFSVYQILNKNEMGGVNKIKIDSDNYSQYSQTADSNNDGISDFYTALINDGIIQYNGSDWLYEVTEMRGADCDDWDGDGLKNGEEISVIDNNGVLTLEIKSNPLLVDSDGDGFDDADEVYNLKSDPLKYTKYGQSELSQLKNVQSYEVSWQDNVARFFEFDEQATVEKFLENYFYDYSPNSSIEKNSAKIDALTKLGDGIEIISQLAKTANNIYSVYEIFQTDFTKIDTDASKVDAAYRAKQKASAENLRDATISLREARVSMIDSLNNKKYTEMYKTALSITKSIEGLGDDVDTVLSGDLSISTLVDDVKVVSSIVKTCIKTSASIVKIKNLSYGTRLLKTYKYQSFSNKTLKTPSNIASYGLTLAVDTIEGASDLNEAITSYSKIEANIDAFNDALGILYDLSITDGLNYFYRLAAKNVMGYVVNASSDYTNEIINLHTKQILVTGSDIAIDTLALFNPYVAIGKAFLECVEIIGINNMAECSIYLEILNEMQKQCVNELNKINIAEDVGGTTITFETDEDRESAELYMTHLAQCKILFEDYMFKYSYDSGISSTLASWFGGVSREKGEQSTKNLIQSVYTQINALELGVSPNLPYYDDFYDKTILSTLNLKETSDERDVVLVIDVSGSMDGTKIEETKKAASKFVDTVRSKDAYVSIVTYDNSASLCVDFSNDKDTLNTAIDSIYANGGTNIEAGLTLANEQMYYSHAKKKIIVLMSDGEPNDGKVGEELVKYANSIKSRGIYLYTLGFFGNSSNVTDEQILMENIASQGCHYEVDDAENLVFFFEDIADMITGQQYIFVKIACPVEVEVSYNGETISSYSDGSDQRATFGTLTRESISDDEEAKILRLKAENEYKINIYGVGTGSMDYMVALMDENGNYNDFRLFENVNITNSTTITSTVNNSSSTSMNIDEDGDGEVDGLYIAGKNQMCREVSYKYVYLSCYSAMALGLILSLLVFVATKNKRRINPLEKNC